MPVYRFPSYREIILYPEGLKGDRETIDTRKKRLKPDLGYTLHRANPQFSVLQFFSGSDTALQQGINELLCWLERLCGNIMEEEKLILCIQSTTARPSSISRSPQLRLSGNKNQIRQEGRR